MSAEEQQMSVTTSTMKLPSIKSLFPEFHRTADNSYTPLSSIAHNYQGSKRRLPVPTPSPSTSSMSFGSISSSIVHSERLRSQSVDIRPSPRDPVSGLSDTIPEHWTNGWLGQISGLSSLLFNRLWEEVKSKPASDLLELSKQREVRPEFGIDFASARKKKPRQNKTTQSLLGSSVALSIGPANKHGIKEQGRRERHCRLQWCADKMCCTFIFELSIKLLPVVKGWIKASSPASGHAEMNSPSLNDSWSRLIDSGNKSIGKDEQLLASVLTKMFDTIIMYRQADLITSLHSQAEGHRFEKTSLLTARNAISQRHRLELVHPRGIINELEMRTVPQSEISQVERSSVQRVILSPAAHKRDYSSVTDSAAVYRDTQNTSSPSKKYVRANDSTRISVNDFNDGDPNRRTYHPCAAQSPQSVLPYPSKTSWKRNNLAMPQNMPLSPTPSCDHITDLS